MENCSYTVFLLRADIWFDDIDPDDIEAAVGSEPADIVRKRTGVTKTDAKITESSTEQLLVKGSTCDGYVRNLFFRART